MSSLKNSPKQPPFLIPIIPQDSPPVWHIRYRMKARINKYAQKDDLSHCLYDEIAETLGLFSEVVHIVHVVPGSHPFDDLNFALQDVMRQHGIALWFSHHWSRVDKSPDNRCCVLRPVRGGYDLVHAKGVTVYELKKGTPIVWALILTNPLDADTSDISWTAGLGRLKGQNLTVDRRRIIAQVEIDPAAFEKELELTIFGRVLHGLEASAHCNGNLLKAFPLI
ncbi:hypothetical protein FA15DRAFT_704254 [Coprinopsis marcescibilis]|uniref:Uncharacterized protein n=1 Tax=Coprinopsis marcescibilis TaxID=230819 RepID=A0A5C3L9C0_COPMA|nr:hypothetical protein FA15DRAFT_704254 [Coprinopsis marcescibilis]